MKGTSSAAGNALPPNLSQKYLHINHLIDGRLEQLNGRDSDWLANQNVFNKWDPGQGFRPKPPLIRPTLVAHRGHPATKIIVSGKWYSRVILAMASKGSDKKTKVLTTMVPGKFGSETKAWFQSEQ